MIKKEYIKTKQIGLWLLLALFFISCNSEEVYDFPGTNLNKVFIPTSNTTVNGYDKYRGTISINPIEAKVSVDVKLPVRSTLKSEKEVAVNLSIDNSLVEAYNQKNGTDFLKLSSDIVALKNSRLVIPAHSNLSTDFVSISINSETVTTIERGKYVIPVTISSVEGSDTKVSENRNTIYVEVDVMVDDDNIWDGTAPNGTLKLDRSQWSATVTPTPDQETGGYLNIFDGTTSTVWTVYYSKDTSYTIDMKGVQTGIIGFNMNRMIPTTSKLSYSVDGNNWVALGSIAANSDDKIALYTAIEARYIKWDFPSRGSSVPHYFYEFNVYTK